MIKMVSELQTELDEAAKVLHEAKSKAALLSEQKALGETEASQPDLSGLVGGASIQGKGPGNNVA